MMCFQFIAVTEDNTRARETMSDTMTPSSSPVSRSHEGSSFLFQSVGGYSDTKTHPIQKYPTTTVMK